MPKYVKYCLKVWLKRGRVKLIMRIKSLKLKVVVFMGILILKIMLLIWHQRRNSFLLFCSYYWHVCSFANLPISYLWSIILLLLKGISAQEKLPLLTCWANTLMQGWSWKNLQTIPSYQNFTRTSSNTLFLWSYSLWQNAINNWRTCCKQKTCFSMLPFLITCLQNVYYLPK